MGVYYSAVTGLGMIIKGIDLENQIVIQTAAENCLDVEDLNYIDYFLEFLDDNKNYQLDLKDFKIQKFGSDYTGEIELCITWNKPFSVDSNLYKIKAEIEIFCKKYGIELETDFKLINELSIS